MMGPVELTKCFARPSRVKHFLPEVMSKEKNVCKLGTVVRLEREMLYPYSSTIWSGVALKLAMLT
jgi:hypothetical protein